MLVCLTDLSSFNECCNSYLSLYSFVRWCCVEIYYQLKSNRKPSLLHAAIKIVSPVCCTNSLLFKACPYGCGYIVREGKKLHIRLKS